MMRSSAALFFACAALALCGCATSIYNKPANLPWTGHLALEDHALPDVMRENSIVVSFSGGGLRAAAFAHGVLTALQGVKTPEGDLLDDVALITSVSGSSLTSAYYGLHGREGMAHFRDEVLLPGFEENLRLSLANPTNLGRMLGGGLNTREDFADVLDKRVFRGAKFADLYRNPRPSIRIHATDLYHRVPFPFVPALFNILCSDLPSYPVADAVAASMAVPLVFAPIVVRTYPESCAPLPPQLDELRRRGELSHSLVTMLHTIDDYRSPRVRYIKLGDGGLTDNFALSTLTIMRLAYGTPYAPMTERDAVRIRRLLLVVVDASRGPKHDPAGAADQHQGVGTWNGATDAAVDSAARQAADAFDAMVRDWQDSLVAYRCALKSADVARLGGPPNWNCRDVRFTVAHLEVRDLPAMLRERIERIPTRLSLDAADIDASIEGGLEGTLALPQLWQYLSSRVAP